MDTCATHKKKALDTLRRMVAILNPFLEDECAGDGLLKGNVLHEWDGNAHDVCPTKGLEASEFLP